MGDEVDLFGPVLFVEVDVGLGEQVDCVSSEVRSLHRVA